MQKVSVILGKESNYENALSSGLLRHRLDDPTLQTYNEVCDGFQNIDRAAITAELAALADPSTGPALMFAALNGRGNTNNDRPRTRWPHGLERASTTGAGSLLRELGQAADHTQKPMQVFMWLGQRPDLIHRHIKAYPHGSVIVGVKTIAADCKTPHMLNILYGLDKTHKAHVCDARTLLVTSLISEHRFHELPEIAISGKPRRHLNDIWNLMAQQGGVTAAAENTLRRYQAELHAIDPRSFSHVIHNIDQAILDARYPGKIPSNNAGYALAVLSVWDKIAGPPYSSRGTASINRMQPVQPVHATGSVNSSQPGAPVIHQSNTSTGQTGHQPNISTHDLAGLPPHLRKYAQAAPGVIRRILRKG